MKQRILVIAGPTASGKSDLAMKLAEQLDGEIVCADSLTVYRGFDIGSAKPSLQQQKRIPHHLLDICEPTETFTAADFRREAALAINSIIARGKRPLLAGGTGLYLRCLLGGLVDAPGEDSQLRKDLQQRAENEGGAKLLEELAAVDPETAMKLHPNNLPRIIRAIEVFRITGVPVSKIQAGHNFSEKSYKALQFCLDLPREELYHRIDSRVDAMISAGLVAEVRQLLDSGVPADAKPMCAIGYREAAVFLNGGCSHSEMIQLIKQNTRRFAKRQLTWFRREQDMQWVAYPENSATIASGAVTFFEQGEKCHVQSPV